MQNLSFHFESATIVAIVGAILAVAVSFGLGLTQDNIHSIMLLVGILGGMVSLGGGIKSGALARAGVVLPAWLHFTPATILSLVGAIIAVALSFGLHLTQQNIESIMTLVGLITGGIVAGGAFKSSGMLLAGRHEALKGTAGYVGPVDEPPRAGR